MLFWGGVLEEAVGVKTRTTESCGFFGREDGSLTEQELLVRRSMGSEQEQTQCGCRSCRQNVHSQQRPYQLPY